MARFYGTRKRGRPSGKNGRPFKRTRRTFKRKSKRASAFSNQSGSGGGLRFRARRMKPVAYRRLLWNHTQIMDHYRTLDSANSNLVTPLSQLSMNIVVVPAIRFTGGAFWTSAGGAIAPDSSNSLPIFTGNIILRGGTIGLRFANTLDTVLAAQNSIQGTVFLVKTSKNYAVTSIPGNVDVGWDPTIIQDFNTKIGRIVYRKNFLLKDSDVFTVEYRMKIRKVDEADYFSDLDSYVWIMLAGNVDNAIAHSTTFTTYYNMSFSGSAI